MRDIRFTAPVVPIGKGRGRAAVVAGHARVFTPDKTRRWESDFAAIASQYAPSSPLEGPLRVDILAVFPRPRRLMRRKDPEGFIWHDSKPDRDNVDKAVLDALRAWWRDDAQVCAGEVLKVYAEKTGVPRVEVRVRSLPVERRVIGDAPDCHIGEVFEAAGAAGSA